MSKLGFMLTGWGFGILYMIITDVGFDGSFGSKIITSIVLGIFMGIIVLSVPYKEKDIG